MKLTISQIFDLVDAIEDAAGQSDHLLAVIAPNGKPFSECSRKYCHSLADALEDWMDEFADLLAANDLLERLQ